MLFSTFDVLRFFEAVQMFFYKFLLKWGKNEENCWVQHILWSSKILFCFWIRAYIFFKWSYLQRCFDVANVVKIYVENDNVVLTLSNVFQFNVQKQNVVSTFFYVVNFNVDIHNVASTLIWRWVTSRRHINLTTTLNRRWNVCWVTYILFF